MQPLKSFFRSFPAFSRVLAITLGSSLFLLLALKFCLDDPRPKAWLLGDSGIGNYRLLPGERLEDALGFMLPEFTVRNWAEPGAHPYDLWLQDQKGRLVAGRPSVIIVVISPDKFYGDSLDRFDENGANLRWLPWNRNGLQLLDRLSVTEFHCAVVEQFDFLAFATADVLRALWLHQVQWPWERHCMQKASSERVRKIEAKTRTLGTSLEAMSPGDDAAFARMPRTQDMEQILEFWKAEGIPVLVVLHPYANPHLLARTWSPKALARRDSITALMLRWLQRQPVKTLNLNSPDQIATFPDSCWDDYAHLKDPKVFHQMAEQIATWIKITEPIVKLKKQQRRHTS